MTTTTVPTSLPWALEGCTYDGTGGDDIRNSTVTPHWFDEGVASGGGSISLRGGITDGAGLGVSPGTGMTVTVAPGSFVVPNTASSIAGGYQATLASSGNLTLAAADPSNPRIDIIVAVVTDLGDSSSAGAVTFVTGTPSATPSVPAAPANSIILAQIAVPAAATSITSGDITDQRPFTAGSGGILKAPKGSVAGYNGQLAFDPVTGVFYHNNPGGARQPKFLPVAPVHQLIGSGAPIAGSGLDTIASITIALDGQTDIKVTANITQITQTSGGSLSGNVYPLQVVLLVDSGTIGETVIPCSFVSAAGTGGEIVAYTSSAAANTPSAGTRTITLKMGFAPAAGLSASDFVTAGNFGFLRVEPVGL